MQEFTEGFLLQASLILALGAQNLFVLESGLKKRRQFLVAGLCSICDAILIAVGVLGAASVFVRIPLLKISFGVIGVLFLIYYGIKKLIEGMKGNEDAHIDAQTATSIQKVILLTLGFSLLNPHVYLDTVILVGGYSSKFFEIQRRFLFGLGAAIFSIIWFFGLAYFAYSLSSLLNNSKSMRVISFVSGFILVALSWKLGTDVYSWIAPQTAI